VHTDAETAALDPPRGMALRRRQARAVLRHSAFRYLFIGVTSVAFDAGLLYALHTWLRVWLPLATFTAVASAFVLNFALNRVWSFGSRGPVGRQFVKYLLLSCVNWVFTVAVVQALAAAGVYYMIGKLIALAMTTVGNYIAYRRWIFSDGSREPGSDPVP
jgi:putative flippase GtrA